MKPSKNLSPQEAEEQKNFVAFVNASIEYGQLIQLPEVPQHLTTQMPAGAVVTMALLVGAVNNARDANMGVEEFKETVDVLFVELKKKVQ